nr:uncharacterized protein CI109_006050 [Kwoniella shandongensis]KAA5525599.1 hypothetical protein CI109_006050 [Kwoniella shandongensis]
MTPNHTLKVSVSVSSSDSYLSSNSTSTSTLTTSPTLTVSSSFTDATSITNTPVEGSSTANSDSFTFERKCGTITSCRDPYKDIDTDFRTGRSPLTAFGKGEEIIHLLPIIAPPHKHKHVPKGGNNDFHPKVDGGNNNFQENVSDSSSSSDSEAFDSASSESSTWSGIVPRSTFITKIWLLDHLARVESEKKERMEKRWGSRVLASFPGGSETMKREEKVKEWLKQQHREQVTAARRMKDSPFAVPHPWYTTLSPGEIRLPPLIDRTHTRAVLIRARTKMLRSNLRCQLEEMIPQNEKN